MESLLGIAAIAVTIFLCWVSRKVIDKLWPEE